VFQTPDPDNVGPTVIGKGITSPAWSGLTGTATRAAAEPIRLPSFEFV